MPDLEHRPREALGTHCAAALIDRGATHGLDGAILHAVGFDPNRKYNATTFDYALVVICLAVALGLVVWAFAG